MFESEDEDHVVANSRKRLRIDENDDAPNVPLSNQQHWKRFNESPTIKKSLQSNGLVQMCHICNMEFSTLYPGHKYSYMGVKYMHDTCFYTHLGLCKCLVCLKMIKFIKHTIVAQKFSSELENSMITVEDDEEEALLEDKLDNHWYQFHISANNYLAGMIVTACKKNTLVASDSAVPDIDIQRKISDPIFKFRNCVNTNILRRLFASCAKIFSDMAVAYNIARINNVPTDQLPLEPDPCIILSTLPYYDLHVCVEKISELMHQNGI
jgi:hypothetical protein